MKKRISLILAIVMVAAMLLTAIPFAAMADDTAELPMLVRIGTVEYDDLGIALEIASMMEQDVTITLLRDIDLGGADLRLTSPKSADGATAYKLILDGNGYKISGNKNNMLLVGADGAKNEDIVIKDLDINFTGLTGAVVHFRAMGNFLIEDVNINCTSGINWGIYNFNIATIEGAVANVVNNNVNMIQPAYGGPGDATFVRVGNGGSNSPYVNYVFNDCNMITTESTWTADASQAVKGIYLQHANATAEFNNCVIKSMNSPIYITSNTTDVPDDGNIKIKLNETKLDAWGIDTTAGTITYATDAAGGTKTRNIIYSGGQNIYEITGTYVEPTGEAQVVTAEGRTPYVTFADALAAANAATVDSTIVLNKDITLAESIVIEPANNEVTLTLDGNGYKVTTSAGNAIKVGSTKEVNVNIVDLDVEYSGVGSAIQIYAWGDVNLTDVKVHSTAKLNWCAVNALNTNDDKTLNVVVDDCVITSTVADGNNDTVSLLRTGNKDKGISNMTVKNTIVKIEGIPESNELLPIAIPDPTSVVIIENCEFVGVFGPAIHTPADLATKVQVKGSILTVNETEDLFNDADAVEYDESCKLTGKLPEADVTTTTNNDGETTTTDGNDTTTTDGGDDATTPSATTTDGGDDKPSVTTPDATTPPPAADEGCAGCGGIAIAAQLVALICAAAVVIIKRK